MSNSKNNSGIEYVMNNIIKSRIMDVAETMRRKETEKINSDVTGSYTGTGNDNEKPIQDVDDL